MISVAFVNTKGGVGKTTLAVALAVRAKQDGMRVALVDLDPQKSLTEWLARRRTTIGDEGGATPASKNAKGSQESQGELCIFEGAPTAGDAVERAELAGYDWTFLDGPPGFLAVAQEMIEAADFALIPLKPSIVDIEATQDVVVLAREAGRAHLCALNDVGAHEKVAGKAHEFLVGARVPVAETRVVHRTSHILAMTVGKSASEVNKGKDAQAASDIEGLWAEVKAAASKAARARARARTRAGEVQSHE